MRIGSRVAEICGDFGAKLKACDGEATHVHVLFEYPPTVSLPKRVNTLKVITGQRLKYAFLDMRAV